MRVDPVFSDEDQDLRIRKWRYNPTLMGAVADWLDEYDEPRRAEVFRLRMRRLEATA